jgi:hypothetical protein
MRTIDAKPASPEWVVPMFLLRRASFRSLSGDPRADEDTHRVLAEPRWKNHQKALLMVARADDLAGRRDQAKREYRRIVDDYEHESASWPAKAGLISLYRRH